jgi:hypothetical protein
MSELPNESMRLLHDNFLFSCRTLYHQGITPFNFDQRETREYQQHVLRGRHLLEVVGTQVFLGYLMEGSYCVDLWAALIGLEYGRLKQNELLKVSGKRTTVEACLNTIRGYYSPTYPASQHEAVRTWVARMEAQQVSA